MRIIGLLVAALLALSGCKHTPPLTLEDNMCHFETFGVEQPLPGRAHKGIVEGVAGDMLLLSGGSQNGAFGAGFIRGWHSAEGGLPEFSLVTGISTGALQATGAFINRPDIAVRGYTIDAESDILNGYVDELGPDGGLGHQSLLVALQNGAISDLTPLRTRLGYLLDDEVFAQVAARYSPTNEDGSGGPRLLVGATDVDLGQAIAFDLTEMADRIVGATKPEKKQHYKDCYIEALIASSVVPPAAKPVFIDNRMYIDGGVRFAVFDDRLQAEIENNTVSPSMSLQKGSNKLRDLPLNPTPPNNPHLYIILNGDGELAANCGRAEEPQSENCTDSVLTSGRHEDWDVVSLAFRSVEILTNQVERLSIARAANERDRPRERVHFARIRPDDMSATEYSFSIPDFQGQQTCNQWRSDDDSLDNPLQFHRRFMRCLIAYGERRGAQTTRFAVEKAVER